MIYQYVVTLKNNSSRYIDRLSLLLLFTSFAFFVREQLLSPNELKIAYTAGALIILGFVVWNLLQQRLQPGKIVFYGRALIITSIIWVMMPYLNWLIVPYAILGLVERQAKMPTEIGFSDDSVVIGSLLRRKYKWTDFNNVVLKDDLLTLDFKNNRLLQRETIDEEGDAEEDEFNDYCRERLAKAHSVLR